MLNKQFLIFENVNMKGIDVLIDIPCFKCLFADPIMESHLHCNPNECEKLTDWLLVQVEQDKKGKETISFEIVHAQTRS
jgi:hypothetical protein